MADGSDEGSSGQPRFNSIRFAIIRDQERPGRTLAMIACEMTSWRLRASQIGITSSLESVLLTTSPKSPHLRIASGMTDSIDFPVARL
jgi:hypothetical protein